MSFFRAKTGTYDKRRMNGRYIRKGNSARSVRMRRSRGFGVAR